MTSATTANESNTKPYFIVAAFGAFARMVSTAVIKEASDASGLIGLYEAKKGMAATPSKAIASVDNLRFKLTGMG